MKTKCPHNIDKGDTQICELNGKQCLLVTDSQCDIYDDYLKNINPFEEEGK
jgi:hypothetical protein